MAKHLKPISVILKEQLAEVDLAIEAAVPELIAKRRDLELQIKQASGETANLFADVVGKIEAVELCLDLTKDWMNQQQIYDKLIEGNYPPMKRATGRALVHDALRHHSKSLADGGSGRLIKRGEGRAAVFGRSSWVSKQKP